MKTITHSFPARSRSQVSTSGRMEALQCRLMKFLGCPLSDITGNFHEMLRQKAGTLPLSNTSMMIAMLEDAIYLAQQGKTLSEIQRKILAHDYLTPNPADVLLHRPYPDPRAWTLREEETERQ